ncbi:MarR family transcriptional regulator [Lactobacillus sp. CBA3605]|uniref:MarR family winged helix-turn-helix transcriptional regulator n=1 Tax=Lactobacillus sp. CBA3605 TaxID=2099788 RepID=UPI000CFC2E93|nr:MarR family transcriptional regulator [Lactobacillus sp. CBA3605]AVK61191.1 MarR family transcriptional regulator [Lactobacillus sp. CBA3605]
MADMSHELFESFGKLMQNRLFFMAVMHQRNFGSHGTGHHGGGRGQMRLLQVLAQSPAGLTNAEIAEVLDIRPSSVSATIKRLETAELVERVPSDTDKRVVIVRLSERGQRLFDQQATQFDDLADQLFGDLTASEQAELQRLLTKLNYRAEDVKLTDFMPRGRGEWPQQPGGRDRHWFN